jgi:phage major head subunit gpT-like protein
VEADYGLSYLSQIAMHMDSDQASEDYAWLRATPALREWIGGRQAKGLTANKITITNKTFEGTLVFPSDDIRRDKIGAIDTRISDLARRVTAHWAKLISTLILNGTGSASGFCYDGHPFFDTDHSEGDSGTQLNLLAAAQVPTLGVVDPTAPTPFEAAQAVLGVIAYMFNYKDDKGEPMNDLARNFLVMTSPALSAAFSAAATQQVFGGGVSNPLAMQKSYSIAFVANPRLTYTTQFVVFRTDAPVKPFILQEEEKLTVSVIGEGSEHEFKNNEQLFGVKVIGNCGYGLWQHAAHATLS